MGDPAQGARSHGAQLDSTTIEELRQTLTPSMRLALAETFREQVEHCVSLLCEAILRSDHEERRHAAHLLRGSSGVMGASGLRSLCARLEQSGGAEDPEAGAEQLEQLRQVASEAAEAVSGALT